MGEDRPECRGIGPSLLHGHPLQRNPDLELASLPRPGPALVTLLRVRGPEAGRNELSGLRFGLLERSRREDARALRVLGSMKSQYAGQSIERFPDIRDRVCGILGHCDRDHIAPSKGIRE